MNITKKVGVSLDKVIRPSYDIQGKLFEINVFFSSTQDLTHTVASVARLSTWNILHVLSAPESLSI